MRSRSVFLGFGPARRSDRILWHSRSGSLSADEGIMHRVSVRAPGFLAQSRFLLAALVSSAVVRAQAPESISVEGQPLAANVERVVRALESLGAPLPAETAAALGRAAAAR